MTSPASSRRQVKDAALRFGCVISSFLVGFAIVSFFAIPLMLSADRFSSPVAETLSKAIGRDIAIDDLSFSWFDGVVVSGFQLESPDGFADRPALTVSEVHLDANLLYVVAGNLTLRSVTLVEPNIYIEKADSGLLNVELLADASSASIQHSVETSGRRLSVSFSLQELHIRNGTVTYLDKSSAAEIRITDVGLSGSTPGPSEPLSFEASGRVVTETSDGRLSGRGALYLFEKPPQGRRNEVSLQLQETRGATQFGRILSYAVPILYVGDSGRVDVEASAELDLAFESLLGERLIPSLNGTGSVMIRELRVDRSPLLNLVAAAVGHAELENLKVSDLRQKLRIENGKVHAESGTGNSSGVPLSMSGWVSLVDMTMEQSIRFSPSIGKGNEDVQRAISVLNEAGGLLVRGSVGEPKLAVDARKLLRGTLEEAARRGLIKLLEGSQEDSRSEDE